MRSRSSRDAISDRLFAGYVRFAEGQPYSPERVRSTQFALEDSNYFSTVTVIPEDPDPKTLTVPVTVRGEPIKRDRYSVSAGYGTDTGVRGKFTWDNRRMNSRGHRWQVQLTASSVLTEAIARYIIPIGDPSLEKLEFSTGYINEEIGDLESERVEVIGSVTEAMGSWQRVLFLKLNEERSIFADGTDQTDLLLIPGASYSSLPPNFLTGWVRDAAYYFELTGSPQTLGSDASYLRFVGRAEKVWRISGPWYLRLRGEVGASWINEFSELPASQRFFAGGDRSVRGFGLNELSPPGPPDENGNPTKEGGENKLIASIEIERDLPRDFRIAAFYDTGNAFNEWGDPLEYSVGVGIRWKLPMLMIGARRRSGAVRARQEPAAAPQHYAGAAVTRRVLAIGGLLLLFVQWWGSRCGPAGSSTPRRDSISRCGGSRRSPRSRSRPAEHAAPSADRWSSTRWSSITRRCGSTRASCVSSLSSATCCRGRSRSRAPRRAPSR